MLNAKCLCKGCHRLWHESPAEAMAWFEDKFGKGRIDIIIEKKNIKIKVGKLEEKEIASHYKEQFQRLEDGFELVSEITGVAIPSAFEFLCQRTTTVIDYLKSHTKNGTKKLNIINNDPNNSSVALGETYEKVLDFNGIKPSNITEEELLMIGQSISILNKLAAKEIPRYKRRKEGD